MGQAMRTVEFSPHAPASQTADAPAPASSATTTVRVALGPRSYDVRIGEGLIAGAAQELAPLLARPKVAIVTDEIVARHHLPVLARALGTAGIEAPALVLPAGEGTKSWAGLQKATEWLLAARIERGDLVLALGGGVIGDLVGFAAAILRRGVRYVQIPTTLLAQVDSSVGGKTGINTAQGKNLVGAFHQPALVLADVAALDTLPLRAFRAGYAEVVKYGLLGDAAFFAWLERFGAAVLLGDRQARIEAVRQSVAMKAQIVARDETEQGERALLNLGHTFGHALEAATGFSDRLLHGEAVALGCVLAARLSERLGFCPVGVADRIAAHFAAVGLPWNFNELALTLPGQERLLALMAQDKKVIAGRLRFVLLRDIGQAFVTDAVPLAAVMAILAEAGAREG